MKRPARTHRALRLVGSLATVLIAAAALSGCEQPPSAPDTAPEAQAAEPAPQAAAEVDLDDTDPDAFDLTEATYWDGRPSLGGLWVAHPLAERPRRVRIVNLDTGETVDGALFRRDGALPGPPIMLSYDAARALDVEPGVVTRIRVVALKDEETLRAEAADRESAEAADEKLEVTALSPAAETSEPAPPQQEAGTGAAAAPSSPAEAPESAAARAAEQEPVLPAGALETSGESAPGTPTDNAVAPAEPEAAETPAAPEPKTNGLKNRFIQIATFQVATNAEKSAEEFRTAGFPATVRQARLADGKTVSRVLLGPFTTAEEQSAAMSAARARAFRDAYYVND